MVEEKEGKYIIGLLDYDTHNWVTGMRAVNGWRKKQRNKAQSNKERRLISVLGLT